MLPSLLDKIFGTKQKRIYNKFKPTINLINEYCEKFSDFSDIEMKSKRNEFRSRLSEGETEKDILPEAFGIVKAACKKMVGKSWMIDGRMQEWNMIPYDVQLIGAIVLAEGKIAEMGTGEGKTLVALFPAYLNALSGKGVHIVTVNDYLAKRDREWMGYILEFLGLTVGVITSDNNDSELKKIEYKKDVVYGVNHEFGFDYLKDNMVLDINDMVQRGFNYCLIDEVDSILIDEARTPLVISGAVSYKNDNRFDQLRSIVSRLVQQQTKLLNTNIFKAEKHIMNNEEKEAIFLILKVLKGAPKNRKLLKLLSLPNIKTKTLKLENNLLSNHKLTNVTNDLYYTIDEKFHTVELFEKGYELLASSGVDKSLFIIPDISIELQKINKMSINATEKLKFTEALYAEHTNKSDKIHIIRQLLKAFAMFEKDVDYVVQDGKIIIVDQSTGRLKEDSRYSDGIHQAIEAKEGLKIEEDTQTIASITYQNYFRMYKKLSGMTGTAIPEESEFFEIYKLKVSVIPTNAPVIRDDQQDSIYITKQEKYNAVINQVQKFVSEGRPVLIGTPDVDISQIMHKMLDRKNIKHSLLNAKNHAREAQIIRNAGISGAVTVATNMAGRGTDIKLGTGVSEKGGLAIIGCERHDSRRIDRQLRGRAGRQGDPGSSKFYISLEDNLMRIFGSEHISIIMDKIDRKDGGQIEHSQINKSIIKAQRRVEMNNLSIRKDVIKYDDVMNKKRDIIYRKRRSVLIKSAISEGREVSFAKEYGIDPDESILKEIKNMIEDFVNDIVLVATSNSSNIDNLNLDLLNYNLMKTMLIRIEKENIDLTSINDLFDNIYDLAEDKIRTRQGIIGDQLFDQIAKVTILNIIDKHWQEHLRANDELRNSIELVGYAQKDPLMEYKRRSFELFQDMIYEINQEALGMIFHF